jgi:hypothetical protein
LREGFASFFSCARTWPQKSGVGRPNAGVEAAGLARRTWRLLGVLPVLLGAAISHSGHDFSVAIVSCAHGFTAESICNYFFSVSPRWRVRAFAWEGPEAAPQALA